MEKHIFKKDEYFYMYSMGKKIRVWAIFTDDSEANIFMEKNDRMAVISCFGKFIFIADKYDN